MRKTLLFICIGFAMLLMACAEKSGSNGSTGAQGVAGPEGQSGPAGAGTRKVYSGTLDAQGYALVSVPEINFSDMPLVSGYYFHSGTGVWYPGGCFTAGYVKFATNSFAANNSYRIVIVK